MRSTLPNTGSCAGSEPMKECSGMQHASVSQRIVSQIFVGQPRFNQLRNWRPQKQTGISPPPAHARNMSIIQKKYSHPVKTQRM